MNHGSIPIDDLPLLTEVVGEGTGGFPMLTEVVGEATHRFPAVNGEIAGDGDDVPLQGELLETMPEPAPAPCDMTPQLLHYLEDHLENAFAQKLGEKLVAAQQLAIRQTIDELKNELPQLIRGALEKQPAKR